MTDRTTLQQYLELADRLIESADKEQLAECARILAMNVAHYEMEYGELTIDHQLNVMQGQLDEMVTDKRPWLEVTPEISPNIMFSTFFSRPHIFIPINCNIVNYGEAPARNVLCRIRIDSVPYVFNNNVKAENDSRLNTLCNDTIEFSKSNIESGIPIFQKTNTVRISAGAENIVDRYFTMESTIYIVQGCVDYTYSTDKHGQTTFRYPFQHGCYPLPSLTLMISALAM